jgi:hypothetical protein
MFLTKEKSDEGILLRGDSLFSEEKYINKRIKQSRGKCKMVQRSLAWFIP